MDCGGETSLVVNGKSVVLDKNNSATLAEFLRDRLRLRGTKVACDEAACGACTVLIDGRAAFACHTLVAQLGGSSIETIEGLAHEGRLHPLQEAFVIQDATQCGFCTPGMIMTLKAALDGGARTRDQLMQAISGNICRCGAYLHILAAAESLL
jgi:aerobic-type carbon monoxide dehydrogenase small subunit (CoxS/CutS family)